MFTTASEARVKKLISNSNILLKKLKLKSWVFVKHTKNIIHGL